MSLLTDEIGFASVGTGVDSSFTGGSRPERLSGYYYARNMTGLDGYKTRKGKKSAFPVEAIKSRHQAALIGLPVARLTPLLEANHATSRQTQNPSFRSIPRNDNRQHSRPSVEGVMSKSKKPSNVVQFPFARTLPAEGIRATLPSLSPSADFIAKEIRKLPPEQRAITLAAIALDMLARGGK